MGGFEAIERFRTAKIFSVLMSKMAAMVTSPLKPLVGFSRDLLGSIEVT